VEEFKEQQYATVIPIYEVYLVASFTN